MPVSEPIGEERRLALMQRLTEVLGEEEARTLMESLPPTSWYNIATKDDIRATKDDIRALKEWTQAEFTNLRGEMKQMFAQQTRTMVFTLVGFAVTIWGSILAIGLS